MTFFNKHPHYLRSGFIAAIHGGKIINQDRFKAKFREQFAGYKNKAIKKMDKEALDYYMFASTKLGWINCDRFWDTKGEKIDFVVKTANAKNSKVQIIFEDIKSIMDGTLKDDQFVFSNIPINRKIKVIGISYSNGKPTMSSISTQVDKDGIELSGFKEFSFDELDKELNR